MEMTDPVGDEREYSLEAKIELKKLRICEKFKFYERKYKHFKSTCEEYESLYDALSTRYAQLRRAGKPPDDQDKLMLQEVEEMRVRYLEDMIKEI